MGRHTSRGSSSAIQGRLILDEPEQVEIKVNEIPHPLALRPGLVKITIERVAPTGYITAWPLPIQWTPEEAQILVEQVRNLSWEIFDNDEGCLVEQRRIWQLCEIFAGAASSSFPVQSSTHFDSEDP